LGEREGIPPLSDETAYLACPALRKELIIEMYLTVSGIQ